MLLILAMMAACGAPPADQTPEVSAAPEAPQNAPPVQGTQDGTPPAPQAPADGQPPAPANGQNAPPAPGGRGPQGGGMGGPQGDGMNGPRGGMGGLDLTTLQDPDKPAGDPAYTGTVVSSENGTLTIRARAYAAPATDAQAPQAPADPSSQSAPQRGGEEMTFALNAAFRVKQASFEAPAADSQAAAPQTPTTTLTQIDPIQLREGDQLTLWVDASGNAIYAIASFGRGMGAAMPAGNRDGGPRGERGEQRGR